MNESSFIQGFFFEKAKQLTDEKGEKNHYFM